MKYILIFIDRALYAILTFIIFTVSIPALTFMIIINFLWAFKINKCLLDGYKMILGGYIEIAKFDGSLYKGIIAIMDGEVTTTTERL